MAGEQAAEGAVWLDPAEPQESSASPMDVPSTGGTDGAPPHPYRFRETERDAMILHAPDAARNIVVPQEVGRLLLALEQGEEAGKTRPELVAEISPEDPYRTLGHNAFMYIVQKARSATDGVGPKIISRYIEKQPTYYYERPLSDMLEGFEDADDGATRVRFDQKTGLLTVFHDGKLGGSRITGQLQRALIDYLVEHPNEAVYTSTLHQLLKEVDDDINAFAVGRNIAALRIKLAKDLDIDPHELLNTQYEYGNTGKKGIYTFHAAGVEIVTPDETRVNIWQIETPPEQSEQTFSSLTYEQETGRLTVARDDQQAEIFFNKELPSVLLEILLSRPNASVSTSELLDALSRKDYEVSVDRVKSAMVHLKWVLSHNVAIDTHALLTVRPKKGERETGFTLHAAAVNIVPPRPKEEIIARTDVSFNCGTRLLVLTNEEGTVSSKNIRGLPAKIFEELLRHPTEALTASELQQLLKQKSFNYDVCDIQEFSRFKKNLMRQNTVDVDSLIEIGKNDKGKTTYRLHAKSIEIIEAEKLSEEETQIQDDEEIRFTQAGAAVVATGLIAYRDTIQRVWQRAGGRQKWMNEDVLFGLTESMDAPEDMSVRTFVATNIGAELDTVQEFLDRDDYSTALNEWSPDNAGLKTLVTFLAGLDRAAFSHKGTAMRGLDVLRHIMTQG